MSDAAEALAPTAINFDAVVAANEAKLAAKEAPDTTENDDVIEVDDADVEEVEDEPEAADDDSEEESDDEESEDDDDPTAQPAEVALKAPFKALREAIKSKRVTPELMAALGDLEMTVTVIHPETGRETDHVLKISEMPGHVMREARFSREMTKTKEDQAKAQHIMQTHQALTNAWRQSPQELARGLQIYGCQEALNVLHRQWAEKTYAFLSASPQEKQRMQEREQLDALLEQERQQRYQAQQKLKQYEQQNVAQQFDEPTRQAGDYINQNMDSALGNALKSAGAGRISDPLRAAFVNELTELAQEGYPLPLAMKEAARMVAERARKTKLLAQGQRAEVEKSKPKEVSGKRAPAGGAPPKRDDGRFQPPSRSSNGKSRSKVLPTAASFGERFGV